MTMPAGPLGTGAVGSGPVRAGSGSRGSGSRGAGASVVAAGGRLLAAGFAELYEREYAGLVRLAFLLVDTDAEAEEVVQDAFTQLLVRWSSIANPGGYLRRCVLNGGRDLQRRRARGRRVPAERREAVEPVADHLLESVRALPPRQRAVIVLRFYEDRTVDDIADVLGMRAGTVKSLIHRALKRLAEVTER